MLIRRRSICQLLIAASSCLLFGQQPSDTPPERNAEAIEILSRVVQAAGGARALASVHDILLV